MSGLDSSKLEVEWSKAAVCFQWLYKRTWGVEAVARPRLLASFLARASLRTSCLTWWRMHAWVSASRSTGLSSRAIFSWMTQTKKAWGILVSSNSFSLSPGEEGNNLGPQSSTWITFYVKKKTLSFFFFNIEPVPSHQHHSPECVRIRLSMFLRQNATVRHLLLHFQKLWTSRGWMFLARYTTSGKTRSVFVLTAAEASPLHALPLTLRNVWEWDATAVA